MSILILSLLQSYSDENGHLLNCIWILIGLERSQDWYYFFIWYVVNKYWLRSPPGDIDMQIWTAILSCSQRVNYLYWYPISCPNVAKHLGDYSTETIWRHHSSCPQTTPRFLHLSSESNNWCKIICDQKRWAFCLRAVALVRLLSKYVTV